MEKGTTHPSSNMPKSRVISNFRKTVHDQRTSSATTRAIFCPGMCRYGHINVKTPTAGSASKKAPAMNTADRKSLGQGKSASVRVAPRGRRLLHQEHHNQPPTTTH